MGRDGEKLHRWMFDSPEGSLDRDMAAEQHGCCGAVILGRRTFEVGLPHWDGTPYPHPSFVLTHEKRPPMPTATGTFSFVDDGIESAIRHAKAAAGGKDVLVMGGATARQFLKAGLADELMLQLMPFLLGTGVSLFKGAMRGEWTVKRSVQSPFATHLLLARA